MRNWGMQGFLNGVDSEDDGWFKFSIKKREDASGKPFKSPVYSIYCRIADCSKSVNLEFGPDIYGDNSIKGMGNWQFAKKQVAARRAKVKKFRDAVDKFAERVLESLDETEAWLDENKPNATTTKQGE